jgi:hypothetical protein
MRKCAWVLLRALLSTVVRLAAVCPPMSYLKPLHSTYLLSESDWDYSWLDIGDWTGDQAESRSQELSDKNKYIAMLTKSD